MALHQYSLEARRRIARAVMSVENTPRFGQIRPVRRVPQQFMPTMAIADADTEHAHFGNVKLATASSFDSSLTTVSGKAAFQAYNPGSKIWKDSPVLIGRACLAGADRGGLDQWIVMQAWSATRIRGTTVAAINHGQTGTINVVQRIDGVFTPTTAQVYLPTAFVDVKSNMVIWAELVLNGATSRWEAYSSDCDGT